MVKLILFNVKFCNKKLFSFAKIAFGLLISFHYASNLINRKLDMSGYQHYQVACTKFLKPENPLCGERSYFFQRFILSILLLLAGLS
jgi:hypothetical protein